MVSRAAEISDDHIVPAGQKDPGELPFSCSYDVEGPG